MILIIYILFILTAFIVVKLICNSKSTISLFDFNVQYTLPLRGLLAILIIIHHYALVEWNIEIPVIQEFMTWGGVVVSVFFFMTGYGLMISYKYKGDKYLSGFIQHRLGKILPPLVIATFCYLAFISVLNHSNSFPLVFELLNGTTPLPTSWFAYAIIFFYIIFFLSAKALSKIKHIILSLWIIATIYIIVLNMLNWENCWYKSTYALNIGFTYAYYEDRIKNFIQKRPQFFAGCVLLTILVLIGMRFVLGDAHISMWKSLVYYLTPLFVVAITYLCGAISSSVLKFLGGISYEIYIVQGAFITLLSPLRDHWALYFILVVVFSISFAWMLQKLCNIGNRLS